ncbi:hypothetical protein BCR33DRAFT_715473 [Rhizoclosmatium globosum]|uniref:Ankyrin n=1 Tax=Rhizoclosmatium globosum TaxID=329046 RepID=A0A1Y2CHD9_9FUNG|nr:hypothetical protein BCR33DRAFT_715473 [Rhizoclosmatium globosum]|eukprot:ORY46356.1 hypothetical protein BCR33DRAFT_715473 [Rhizoclosmatium globosum]
MIESLPIELIQAILIQVPIDSELAQIGLATKHLKQVLDHLSFAKKHVSYHWQFKAKLIQGASTWAGYPIWQFLKDVKLFGKHHWPHLPLSYQAAIYGTILASDEWEGVGRYWDNNPRNLMWSLRWNLSPHRAFKVMQVLFTDGVNVNVQNHRALVWASRAGWTDVVDLVLSRSDLLLESSVPLNVALRNAARFGHVDEENAAFIYSARYGRVPGVDPSARDSLALQLAASRGHVDVVDILLKIPGVDPCADDEYAFAIAVKHSHVGVVKLLLEDGRVDPTLGDYFEQSCIYGDIELVKALLEDSRVQPSCDFLIKASRYAEASVVKILLEYLDPTDKNLTCLLEDPRIILTVEEKKELLSCPQWAIRPEFRRLLE